MQAIFPEATFVVGQPPNHPNRLNHLAWTGCAYYFVFVLLCPYVE